MKRRQWTSETKARVVLSGLRGQPVAAICNDCGIRQSQYYLWWDQSLGQASEAFDTQKVPQTQQRPEQENNRLKGPG